MTKNGEYDESIENLSAMMNLTKKKPERSGSKFREIGNDIWRKWQIW